MKVLIHAKMSEFCLGFIWIRCILNRRRQGPENALASEARDKEGQEVAFLPLWNSDLVDLSNGKSQLVRAQPIKEGISDRKP